MSKLMFSACDPDHPLSAYEKEETLAKTDRSACMISRVNRLATKQACLRLPSIGHFSEGLGCPERADRVM